MEASIDLTCGVLATAEGDPASLHRFVVGVDAAPVPLGQQEIAALGDLFATNLLARGEFPRTASELLERLVAAVPDGDPLAAHNTFMVGEGSQLPPGSAEAGLRSFVVTVGEGGSGPDLIISTPGPDSGFVEVMAWDFAAGGFNYYQTRSGDSPWVIAGNSADSQRPDAAGNGPFESHPNGHPLMKELRFPWVHWGSPVANVRADVVGADLAVHPWFKDARGADELEPQIMLAIDRWTAARFDAAIGPDGSFAQPRRIVESLLGTPTVNLVSSRIEAIRILNGAVGDFDVPHAFFVDTECLHRELGLPAFEADRSRIASAHYTAALNDFGFALRIGDAVVAGPPADTHFAFVVPERAFEDIATLKRALGMGLISRRLAACLLMVDFSNPVFSDRRAALLAHVPDSATIVDGRSTFSDELADAIRSSPEAAQEGTPQQEFAQLWDVGEEWPGTFGELLTAYYDLLAGRLASPDGVRDVVRLAESRRQRVRAMPISEHPLLFATPEPVLDEKLRMTATAEIEEIRETEEVR